jgi:hypothetical protein
VSSTAESEELSGESVSSRTTWDVPTAAPASPGWEVDEPLVEVILPSGVTASERDEVATDAVAARSFAVLVARRTTDEPSVGVDGGVDGVADELDAVGMLPGEASSA